VEDAVRWIADVAAAGVDGIEAIRPSASSRDRRTLRRVARDAGLFVTGGSDWHGWGEPDLGLFAVTAPEIADFVARVGGPIAVAC
jgi:sugar phosphate isomerase/epimerase